MTKELLAAAILLWSTSPAFAGATVNIRLTPTPIGPYEPGETIKVDVSWNQIGAGGDGTGGQINLRLSQFDFRDSNDDLGLSNWKWVWDGQGACSLVAALCGNLHTTDSTLPIVSATYLGTQLDNLNQVIIPANGGVRVGTIDVALPMTPGDYVLDARSAASAGGNPNQGARLDWDFNDHGGCYSLGGQNCIFGGMTTLTVIPEPASILLLCLGGYWAIRRPRKSSFIHEAKP